MMKKINSSFSVFVFLIGFILILFAPNMTRNGMFVDGLLYSALANNLSHGIGSSFQPSFNQAIHTHFYSHPPLAFILESYFFKLLGSSFLTDRIYDGLTLIALMVLIFIISKSVFKNNTPAIHLLPILLWLSIPIVSWSIVNNMLEITMTIFDLVAVLLIVNYSTSNNKNINLILSGIFIVLAFCVKGFIGLFPLSAIVIKLVVDKEFTFSKICKMYVWQLVPVFLFVLLVFYVPPLKNYFLHYFNEQILFSLTKEVNDSRFFIVGRLLSELIPIIIIVVVIKIINPKQIAVNNFNNQNFKFFLFIGLSGVLPLMISQKQSGFYMFAALPFFALAASSLIAKPVQHLMESKGKNFLDRILLFIGVLLISISFILTINNYGKFNRDENTITDMEKIMAIVPQRSTIGGSNDLFYDWSLAEYFQRFNYVTIDCCSDYKFQYSFVILNKSTANQFIPLLQAYTKVELSTKQFDLYKHK